MIFWNRRHFAKRLKWFLTIFCLEQNNWLAVWKSRGSSRNFLFLNFPSRCLNQNEAVWPESLGPKTPKGNLKTPKKNTTLKTRKHHVFGYKNTKYLIKSFKNGPPKHFYCIFVHQFLKNFNFFTEIFQKISIFSNF